MQSVSIVPYCFRNTFLSFFFHPYSIDQYTMADIVQVLRRLQPHTYTEWRRIRKKMNCIFKCFELQWNGKRAFLPFFYFVNHANRKFYVSTSPLAHYLSKVMHTWLKHDILFVVFNASLSSGVGSVSWGETKRKWKWWKSHLTTSKSSEGIKLRAFMCELWYMMQKSRVE